MKHSTQAQRRFQKLVRSHERSGVNTTALGVSKKQWIKINVEYSRFFK